MDNSAGSPGSDNAPRVTEEVYRPSEDESGNGSDTDLDSGDEMVVQQGQGGAKEAKKRASKFRKKSAENKDDGEEKAEEENEELKVGGGAERVIIAICDTIMSLVVGCEGAGEEGDFRAHPASDGHVAERHRRAGC